MTIFIGADHAGFELKGNLTDFLEDLGYEVIDKGAYKLDPKDDYPDFMAEVALAVADNPKEDRGIVIGGGGQGEAIVSNRFKGVRAAVFYGPRQAVGAVEIEGTKSEDLYEIVRLARTHNNANILSLAARFVTENEAKEAVKLFLETKFPGEERHKRRIDKIDQLEPKV